MSTANITLSNEIDTLYLVGDVHGKVYEWNKMLKSGQKPNQQIIQLGDLGIGFAPTERLCPSDKRFLFIRGNHDDPYTCQMLTRCYLGDFGVLDFAGKTIFYLSGANSFDKSARREHIDWWANEELSAKQSLDAIDLYIDSKPDIVLTHDCPQSIADIMFGIKQASSTRLLLQTMLDIHRPKTWVFGHHHKTKETRVFDTEFICLDELFAITITSNHWL